MAIDLRLAADLQLAPDVPDSKSPTWDRDGAGYIVRRLRTAAGLSQHALSARLGSSRTRITWIESGRQGVTLTQLAAIADACGLALTLWGAEEVMPRYRVNGMHVHLKLGGRAAKNPPAPCRAMISDVGPVMRCCGISLFLCDHQLLSGGTCDMPLCSQHATEVGRDKHLCPEHAPRRAEVPGEQPGLF